MLLRFTLTVGIIGALLWGCSSAPSEVNVRHENRPSEPEISVSVRSADTFGEAAQRFDGVPDVDEPASATLEGERSSAEETPRRRTSGRRQAQTTPKLPPERTIQPGKAKKQDVNLPPEETFRPKGSKETEKEVTYQPSGAKRAEDDYDRRYEEWKRKQRGNG